MNTWIDLIDEWGGPGKFARSLGLPYQNAYRMRARNSVHASYWSLIVARAPQAGVSGVTLELLASLQTGALDDDQAGRFRKARKAATDRRMNV